MQGPFRKGLMISRRISNEHFQATIRSMVFDLLYRVYAQICKYIYIYIADDIYIHTYIYTYIYIYTYKYTYTYMYMYILGPGKIIPGSEMWLITMVMNQLINQPHPVPTHPRILPALLKPLGTPMMVPVAVSPKDVYLCAQLDLASANLWRSPFLTLGVSSGGESLGWVGPWRGK